MCIFVDECLKRKIFHLEKKDCSACHWNWASRHSCFREDGDTLLNDYEISKTYNWKRYLEKALIELYSEGLITRFEASQNVRCDLIKPQAIFDFRECRL